MTRRAAVVLVCAVTAGGFACRQDPEVAARKFVASGDRYAAEHHYKESIIEYGNAAKLRPGDAAVYEKLARAYAETGDPLKAYGSYARAADLDPSRIDAQVHAGTLLLAAGEYNAARSRADTSSFCGRTDRWRALRVSALRAVTTARSGWWTRSGGRSSARRWGRWCDSPSETVRTRR